MKLIAIAAILAVVVAIATSCGDSDDHSAAKQAALIPVDPTTALLRPDVPERPWRS